MGGCLKEAPVPDAERPVRIAVQLDGIGAERKNGETPPYLY